MVCHRSFSARSASKSFLELLLALTVLTLPGRAANLAPKVSLIQPTSGQLFANPASIDIAVQAEDADGFVRTLQLMNEVGPLCAWTPTETNVSPARVFQWTWTKPPVGQHKLVAQATDDQGASTYSEPVLITVQTDPVLKLPVLSIEATVADTTEPAPNTKVQPGVFTIKRTGDTSRELTIFLTYEGSARAGIDYKALPDLVTMPANASAVQLLIAATEDTLYEPIESVVATLADPPVDRLPEFTIDPQRNTAKILIHDNGLSASAHIDITTPKDGAVFNSGVPITLKATAIDPAGYIARVEFYDSNTLLGVSQLAFFRAPDPGTPIDHQFEWTNPTAGPHVLTARAVDSKGNAVVSNPVKIQVLPAGVLPTVSVVCPDFESTEFPSVMSYADFARFTFFREGDLSQDLEVVFSLHGTATPGRDYVNPGHYVVLPAGQRETSLTIEPLWDGESEPMETLAIRLEDPMPVSALPKPPTPYQIAQDAPAAAAVIYDQLPPQAPVIQFALPNDGDVVLENRPLDVLAAVFHPTLDVPQAELYADGNLVATSSIGYVKFPPGGAIVHRFHWEHPLPGDHFISVQAKLQDGTGLLSGKIRITVRPTTVPAYVYRQLPDSYTPGQSFTVRLYVSPPAQTSAYAVQDRPPKGWNVSQISDNGAFDPVTGEVKFGVFTDNGIRILTYTLTPPAGALGPQPFAGSSAFDGELHPIAGASSLDSIDPHHPADLNPANFGIDIAELTAYAAAWKQGRTWPSGPLPIPVTYVTRAAQLWKQGEKYAYNPAQGPPPLCWSSANPVVGPATLTRASEAVRQVFAPSQSNEPALVQIKVVPDPSAAAYAVEERLPSGWTAGEVSDDGMVDAGSNCIRWGFYLDSMPRLLSYRVTPNLGSSASPSGVLSCDGAEQPITQAPESGESPTPPTFRRAERLASGSVQLELSGSTGQSAILEVSLDLVHWTELAPITLRNGPLIYEDHSAGSHDQRFYRTRHP